MKKIIALFLMLVLSSSVAHAGIFNWLTGWVVEGTGTVKEQVKCNFINSNAEQKCYTDDGKFACSEITSCTAEVSGENGQALRWKSSCGGEAYTKIDGVDDSLEFKCEPIAIPAPTSTEAIAVPAGAVYEEVTCDFAYSNAIQQCYSEDKKFSCAGKDRCLAKIYGKGGERIIFKGTCKEGYSEILIDGVYNNVWFNCEQVNAQTPTPQTPTPMPIPAETPIESIKEPIKEQVRCVFKNSNAEQKCYTTDGRFSCSGTGSCIADIYGQKGAQVPWKSSCGGYDYTFLDGTGEDAEFECESTPASASTKDKVMLHYFYWENGCSLCESEKSFLENLKLKYPQVGYDSYSIDAPSGGNVYSYYVAVNLKKEMPTIFLDDKIWAGYNDNIAAEIESKVNSCIEKGCSLTPVVHATKASPVQSTQNSIPSMPAQEVPSTKQISDSVKEQVECIFWNSDVIKNPHTARPEECYGDIFGCKWTGEAVEKEVNGNKIRYARCIAEVSGASGTQLIWKSSCGGYAYTTIDGNDEAAEFKCVPSSEVKKEQISGKGFKRAYWQCYDGSEQKQVVSADASCKSTEEWQNEAENFCKGHCYADGSKCGVNSFSVMDECYIEAENEGVIFASSEKPKGEKKFAMPPNSKIGDIMAVYFYSDACKHCLGMDEEIDRASKELNINIKRADAANEPELVESYGIKGVPAFLVLRYESDGIKEFIRYGKADSTAIINWITKPPAAEAQEKPAEIKKLKEEILICKDSCPLNEKCYPFGYRKGGEYCSDGGAFKEQLKEDSVCENSFECSTNVCVDEKCISSGLIQKIFKWLKKLLPGEKEAKDAAKTIDCGTSSECMEDAFKSCKPAKMGQGRGGPISEMAIVGLEGKKCVLKMKGSAEMTGGAESMICKFENYALGMKNAVSGPMEQYCEGPLTFRLAAAPKMIKVGEVPALNSVVKAIKLSEDANDLRYNFMVHDPEGIREFSIVKSNFGEVLVKAEPPCTKDFTSELKFETSDLPFMASVIDCGTPVARQELKVDIGIPVAEKAITEKVKMPAQTETLNAISACEKIRETGLKYKCMAMVKKDSSDCERVDEPAKAYCYADVALVAKDSTICGKIKDSSGHKEACEALVGRAQDKCSKWIYADYCYRDAAALIGDTSICDQIKYEGGKINCKAVILKDASLCQNSDGEDCYQMLALSTGDEKVCDELKKRGEVEAGSRRAINNLDKEVSKCIKMAKREITGCSPESGSGIDCDLIPAMAENLSLCNNLEVKFFPKDRCYFYAAMRAADLLPPQLMVLRN